MLLICVVVSILSYAASRCLLGACVKKTPFAIFPTESSINLNLHITANIIHIFCREECRWKGLTKLKNDKEIIYKKVRDIKKEIKKPLGIK